jgi:mRNA interferase MazF
VAIRRGQVYFVNLDPTVGREQSGRRPVVVVSSDLLNQLPLVVSVVPGTRTARASIPYPWNVAVPAGQAGLTSETTFLTFQVRALDHSRFRDPPIGSMDPKFMQDIEIALAGTLQI